ncbi:MAG: N-6 DNA methylase [Candidatus Hermodarchaeota archaeon]
MVYIKDKVTYRLFHSHMQKLGFPSPTESGLNRYDQHRFAEGDRFDGCYIYQGCPLVLVELKMEGKISNIDGSLNHQKIDKVLEFSDSKSFFNEKFKRIPPYLLVSDGINFVIYETDTQDLQNTRYRTIDSIVKWKDVIQALPGEYSPIMLQFEELVQKIRPFIVSLQESIERQIERIKHNHTTDLDGISYRKDIKEVLDGLVTHLKRSLSTSSELSVTQEITAISTLNYLNKIIFFKYIEGKDPESYFRILKEYQVVISRPFELYIQELKTKILDNSSWFEIVRRAFCLDDKEFSKSYHSVYDFFYPPRDEVIELMTILKQHGFEMFSEYQIGELYQRFLKICQQQQNLGAFYTPQDTVKYMIQQLDLSPDKTIIDPACGSGHFLEACILELRKKLVEGGIEENKALMKAIRQVWGTDIDPFAIQLSTIRLFFLGAREAILKSPNIFVFDSLAMELLAFNDPRVGQLASQKQRSFSRSKVSLTDYLTSVQTPLNENLTLTTLRDFKRLRFDYFIGNPPYGGKPSIERKNLYKRIYRTSAEVYNYRLGSNDVYGLFLANAIKRVKDGGKICFLISDTFLSLRSHYMLRRLILDTCKINEILLAPINLFRPMAISRSCIITLTKRLCEKGYTLRSDNKDWQTKRNCLCKACKQRQENKIRLVDRIIDQTEYENPPSEKMQIITQEEYEDVFNNPFWINVPAKYVETMKLANPKNKNRIKDDWKYEELREHIDGGVGLQTGDNPSHLVIIKNSKLWKKLQRSSKVETFRVMDAEKIADLTIVGKERLKDYQTSGIKGEKFLVPFVRRAESRYWGTAGWYIDWSRESVEQIKNRSSARFQNTHLYFQRGFITNAHHGILKATLVEYSIPAVNTNLYSGIDLETEVLLGYLNSKLASFFLGKIINTSLGGMSGHATPEDIRRLPIRLPIDDQTEKIFQKLKTELIKNVTLIIDQLKKNLQADISILQEKIDSLVFEWFGFTEKDRDVIERYIKQMKEERELY